MWDKLNIFGWKKKSSVQPVQREVSITLTNGDRQEATIQRSPSGTKLASSASVRHGFEDDDSSEGSTSLNFGVKANPSPRRNSSFSFSREPLDLPMWSNVTSPGFTSRLVHQASGHSPLKEFNDSLSFSPFRKSPHGNMKLGELPHVSFARKPKLSPPAFPSPQKSLRSGVSSSVYNRDRRRHARQGTVFVRIAPIDPSAKANVSHTGKSPSPTVSFPNSGSLYPPRGSPRTNEPYRSEGLGGIPHQELAMRFNRMWPPSPPGSPVHGRPASPTSPSNIVEALTANRKRGREQETYFSGPNMAATPTTTPTKISIGIGDTPVRPQQMSKRVKFLNTPEGHDRPMMAPYSGMGSGDNEPLSSESILEKMNQTEKRFLPDSSSTPYSLHKKSLRMSQGPGCEEQSSALQSALRKRRSQSNVMSAVEEEAKGEKIGRFCRCNECYAEAAGVSSFIQPPTSPNRDYSRTFNDSNKSDEKSTNTGETKQTCDKGIGTDNDRVAYFREIYRNPENRKSGKDQSMEGKVILTKEMYDKDKKKRIERYYRILSMKPPGGTIFDVVAEDEKKKLAANKANTSATTPESNNSSTLNSNSASLISDGNTAGASASNNKAGFSFGSPSVQVTTASEGLSFGKQTSPVAPTITTNACSTISSPSSSGNTVGSSSVSSTSSVPQSTAVNTTFSMGLSSATSIAAPSTAAGGFGISSTNPRDQVSFTSGVDGLSKPQSVGIAEFSNKPASTTNNNTSGTSSGLIFSDAPSVPSFGQFGVPITTSLSTNTTSAPPTFGGFGSAAASPLSFFSTTTSTVAGSGVSTTTTSSSAAPSVAVSNSGGFVFGKPADSGSANTTDDSTGTTQPPPNMFGSTPASTSTIFGLPAKSTDAVDNKTETTSSAIPGGFSFGASSTTTTAPSTTSTVTLTSNTNSSTTNIFGSLGTGQPTTNANAPTLPSFGQGAVFGQPSTTTTAASTVTNNTFVATFGTPATTASNGGFSFGASANSQTPSTTAGSSNSDSGSGSIFGASAPSTTGPILFGQGTSATGLNTTASSVAGGGSQTSGGFSFSSVPNPLANKTPATTTSSTFGQFGTTPTTTNNPAFGSITATTAAPASVFGGGTSTFGSGTSSGATTALFGQASANSASTFGSGSSFNSPASGATATASGGGFSFGKSASTPGNNATSNSTFSASSPSSGSGIFGAAAPAPSGNQATSPFGQSISTGGTSAFGASNTASSGGFNFSTVPNPLANKPASAAVAPSFGGFGSSATTTASTPLFGSLASTTSTPAPIFGGGGANTSNTAGGFGFGGASNTLSPPQSQPTSGGFGFGSGTQQQTLTSPQSGSSSTPGFAFGQSNTSTSAPPSAGPGVFQFGQANNPGPAPGVGFQFGQQAPAAGGFNFAAAAPPAMPGQPMFSMGTASTAPRRRDPRRRR